MQVKEDNKNMTEALWVWAFLSFDLIFLSPKWSYRQKLGNQLEKSDGYCSEWIHGERPGQVLDKLLQNSVQKSLTW